MIYVYRLKSLIMLHCQFFAQFRPRAQGDKTLTIASPLYLTEPGSRLV
jgi:hypothetical protein